MPSLPIKPVHGKKIPDGWFRQLWEYIAQLKPVRGDGKTIMVRNGVISAIRQEGTGTGGGGVVNVKLAVIKHPTDTWTYTADIYDNIDEAPVESNVIVKVVKNQLNDGETIPYGTVLDVIKRPHGTGNEKRKYWTVIGLTRTY